MSHLPNQPNYLDTRAVTTTPDIVPLLWTCCLCGHQATLLCPGPAIVEDPTHSKFPLARKARDAAELATLRSRDRCPVCLARHCLRCAVHDAQGRPICTFGGRNLRADRLVPAGWACCGCGRQHMGTGRYRSDKFVWMGELLGDGRKGALAFVCECLRASDGRGEKEEKDAAAASERPETHYVCKDCVVINKYGERLGSLDTESFVLLPNPPSCLRENFDWFIEQRKFLLRERNKMLEARKEKDGGPDDVVRGVDDITRQEEDAEMEKQLEKAAEDFEAAREEVAKVKRWIQAFWKAVGAQEWATRMRREKVEAVAAAGLTVEGGKKGKETNAKDDSGLGDSIEGEEHEEAC